MTISKGQPKRDDDDDLEEFPETIERSESRYEIGGAAHDMLAAKLAAQKERESNKRNANTPGVYAVTNRKNQTPKGGVALAEGVVDGTRQEQSRRLRTSAGAHNNNMRTMEERYARKVENEYNTIANSHHQRSLHERQNESSERTIDTDLNNEPMQQQLRTANRRHTTVNIATTTSTNNNDDRHVPTRRHTTMIATSEDRYRRKLDEMFGEDDEEDETDGNINGGGNMSSSNRSLPNGNHHSQRQLRDQPGHASLLQPPPPTTHCERRSFVGTTLTMPRQPSAGNNIGHNNDNDSYSNVTNTAGGSSLDMDGNAINEQSARSNEDKQNDSRWWKVPLITLVVLGLVIGIAIPLVSRGGKDNNNNEDTSRPTTTSPTDQNSPTLSPTKLIDYVKRGEAIMSLLTPDITSDSTLFDDPTTPQSLALDWIVHDDITYSIDPTSSINTNNARLVQRYILAVFYYSTTSNNDDDDDDNDGWILRYNWLSPIDDECEWEYISCNNFGSIIGITIEDRNKVNGPLPNEISSLSSLEEIIIKENSIQSIPYDIQSLAGTLKTLHIEENVNPIGFVGTNYEIPSVIYELTSLQNLILTDNKLVGTISSNIGQLVNLQNLQLGGISNKLNGLIPSELYTLQEMSNLEFISFGGIFMNLQGNITDIIIGYSNIDNLQLSGIDFGGNNITGTIPTTIGLLNPIKLIDLALDNNEISGTIPSEIGLLSNIQRLTLDNNNIVSTIPTELGLLVNITEFWFGSNNDMSGTVPKEICDNIIITIDNIMMSSPNDNNDNNNNNNDDDSFSFAGTPIVRDCNVECLNDNCCGDCT